MFITNKNNHVCLSNISSEKLSNRELNIMFML